MQSMIRGAFVQWCSSQCTVTIVQVNTCVKYLGVIPLPNIDNTE